MGDRMKNIRRKKLKKMIGGTLLIMVVILFSILFIFPFIWLLSATFQPVAELLKLPPRIIPKNPSLDSYFKLIDLSGINFNYMKFYFNSIVVALVTTFTQVLFATMSGYGFSRFPFKGSSLIFMLLLSGMMVPIQVIVIPIYMFYSKLHLTNTLIGLILPMASNVFGMFLFRQTFVTLPIDIEEAAYIDGASVPYTFFRIVISQVKGTMAAFVIIAFNNSWNAYFLPLILASKPSSMTLPVGITMLNNVYSTTDYSVLFAGVVLAILPIFILFVFFQKYFIEGLAAYAIKG